MHLKITQFDDLLIAVKKFGVSRFLDTKIVKERKQFKNEGLDIDLSDVFSTNKGELFIILKNGSIRKAIIHIVDISSYKKERNHKYPKFHIYSCKTIEEMKSKNKKHRYKASSRQDGLFYLIKKEKKWYEALEICQNCLTLYNSHFKVQKTKKNFPLQGYIKKPIRHSWFADISIDHCTVPNSYTKSWQAISQIIKKQYNYLCSTCSRDFSTPECKKFLHTHHINADKRDNNRENLKVLCIECHSKEHNHSHIKQSREYKEYLKSHCCY